MTPEQASEIIHHLKMIRTDFVMLFLLIGLIGLMDYFRHRP